jgi:hypothetical protein
VLGLLSSEDLQGRPKRTRLVFVASRPALVRSRMRLFRTRPCRTRKSPESLSEFSAPLLPNSHDCPHSSDAGVLGVHRTHLGDTATAERVSFKRATHPMKQHPTTDLPPFIHALLLAITVSAIVGWALTQLIP